MEQKEESTIKMEYTEPATKTKKTKIGALFIFCLIICLTIGFCVGKFCFPEIIIRTPEAQTTEISNNESDNIAMEYKEVSGVLYDIYSSNMGDVYGVYGASTMMILPDELHTYIPSKYALSLSYSYESYDEDDSIKINNLETLAKKVLTENNFESIGIVPFTGSAGPEINGYSEGKIQCNITKTEAGMGIYKTYSYELLIECANKNWTWLADSELAIAKEFEQAYYEKKGNYPRLMDSDFDNFEIVDSEYPLYQHTWISVGGANGIFYRTSSESPWIYFTATQGVLNCSDYDSDDLKKAFLGEKCFIEDGSEFGTISKVAL